jgi:hypothetical protein
MSYNCPPPSFQPGPPCNCDCTVSPPRRQVERFRDPTPEPIIRQERRRNPTPPGDVVERIIVKRQPQEIIERVTEQPRKPAPQVLERVELEGPPPPLVKDSCIYVDPSLKPCPCGPLTLLAEPALLTPAPLSHPTAIPHQTAIPHPTALPCSAHPTAYPSGLHSAPPPPPGPSRPLGY